MSTASSTTQRIETLRPAAVGAVFGASAALVAVALLAGAIGLAGTRTLTSQQAPAREAPAPLVGGTSRAVGSTGTGIPYVGTGTAAQIIRGEVVVTVHDTGGIPYVGSGPAAEIIRGTPGGAVVPIARGTGPGAGSSGSGIPYEGTGLAAQIIRDSLSSAP